ncbi:MAG TPA: group II intron reverse transcriptase/maturase [Thermoanaerobaculia bacterium]|nr:group II intron reverse transcriptase/maturase [Thermoanaerobaculia bacterium]
MMYDQGKSDPTIVPGKSPNKAGRPAAEAMEGRGGAKGNAGQQRTRQTQSWVGVSQALDRIRQAARRDRKARFTALLHHVTVDLLRWAFLQLRRKAAPGADGVTWAQYEAGLEENLRDLHVRVQRGAYRAWPSRRQYIPKPDGRRRPLGVAALEDKIVQRAVVEVLNAIYETDFLGFSYGFRPGRSQHDALDALAVGLQRRKVNWVLDADIRAFFDSLSHAWLMRFLEHRIGDRRVLRLIGKWLKAGVLEDGTWAPSEEGTPQGAVISPLLANVYLHYVYDLWVERWRRREARGEMIVVRYADDTIVGFEDHACAEQFARDLAERLDRFALTLNADKTRLIEFGRFAAQDRARRGLGKPETFQFLGFTHICGKSRAGKFLLLRHTARTRLRERLRQIKVTLRRNRHRPIAEQGRWLGRVVNGYFAYHAVPTNCRALNSFYREVVRHWLRALRRRGQRHRLTYRKMFEIAATWLPAVRVRHPYPADRFAVRHPRWEPSA